jgi:two-component system CheB/CheR fusion protein
MQAAPPRRPKRGSQTNTRPTPALTGNDFPVVGIGASAGGLEACRKLICALPANHGMAVILVQHLDPTHDSMLVDLLADHTTMNVQQATDGMPIERNHLYIIPPGAALSVSNGALRLSPPTAKHGARLPIDFLLNSLASEYGPRAIAVILSGTGADGSSGLKAIRGKGGSVIVQDPDEAGYDGMPRSAIMTGLVNIVLPVEKIPAVLVEYGYGQPMAVPTPEAAEVINTWLADIIDLLRTNTAHDFTLYKHGTLQRRIERRMGMGSIELHDKHRYLEMLRASPAELDLLAKDLLINVTGFFRDPQVFKLLEKTIVPELIAKHPPDTAIRIWIIGCSTGEEAYSLAILFREQLIRMGSSLKLQVFASDVDGDAIAQAREGIYPKAIETEVSPERLSRFFSKEENGYRILRELRGVVVFTVQDILADPPFSKLDLVSCRNLLIYLSLEAQAKVIALCHFALREGAVLLLGSAETVGKAEDKFKIISKTDRLYRHTGRRRMGQMALPIGRPGDRQNSTMPEHNKARSRQDVLADLCRQLVMEAYAPAAVLLNRKHELLYSLGPVDRYLRIAPGHHSSDLLAMASDPLRTKLWSAIQQAGETPEKIVVRGPAAHGSRPFNIAAQAIASEGEELLLICFLDEPAAQKTGLPAGAPNTANIAELQHDLHVTKAELQNITNTLRTSSEEQRAINEEALSVNEEYQSTNEELISSKEELQSLNEELTALNSQLQETLEKQRTTYDDLQNVLYSTDVATIFLDTDFNIRFFTPATKALFRVIPGDIGRPLADLNSLAADSALLTDAALVLKTLEPAEREIQAQNDVWYMRRILPYRTQDDGVEGIVITFADITERKYAGDALAVAKREAELASVAKSRFLAAASHDLRQPLQTLALLQGLLAKTVTGDKAQKLIVRLDETLDAMSGMLNTLLDINQIEAGAVQADIVSFPIDDLLTGLRDEFAYHAEAKGLTLRVVTSGMSVDSDPRLLEQMLRNLLANALKYTKRGKILLGCRRHRHMLSIEIWDTGVGIPKHELQAIFEEYHQLDNAARERNRGLGLGLSIVQRLGEILGHRVHVRSQPNKGSVFTVEIALSHKVGHKSGSTSVGQVTRQKRSQIGSILVVEDDPELRELLEVLLRDDHHHVVSAGDGIAALELVARDESQPDIILADYNLPGGMNGLQFMARLREDLHLPIPAIILTGDISTGTLRDIAQQNCLQLNKPVKTSELLAAVQTLLTLYPAAPVQIALPLAAPVGRAAALVYIVDDNRQVRDSIRSVLEEEGQLVEDYASSEAFLAAYRPGGEVCLLIDADLPGMSGFDLLGKLRETGYQLPSIMITGHGDVPLAVRAIKAGAIDFIEKPISYSELLASVDRALEQARNTGKRDAWHEDAASSVASLTLRQRQIMDMVLAGHPNKNIAADLGISQRTVENHRASIMKKTGSKSLPALARLALAATPP